MTDSPTPEPGRVDTDVELASAHLDGEVGPDDRARVEDPAVQAHLGAFAGIAEQVGESPPPPAGLLDDHVARAMEAFDDDGTVVAMGRDRSTIPWWQRIPLGAVAAALLFVVAVVGIAGLAAQSGDDDADTATAALEGADQADGEAGTTMQDDSAAAGAMEEGAALESGAASDAAGDRPAFDTYEDLATAIREELDAPASAPDESDGPETATTSGRTAEQTEGAAGADGASDPCGAIEVLGIDPAAVVLVRPVVVGPDPVTAVVHDAEDGRRLAVVDDATCTVVLDRVL